LFPVRRSAAILGVPIDDAAASEIGRRARGTPRIANRLLRRVRDYAQVRAGGHITLDVAQAARPHLKLQNTIHWIKSIAIEKALAGARAGLEEDLAVGHYKPINSERFLHDCHEFVFHFTPEGDTPLRRRAIGVRYQDKSNVARWRAAADDLRCRGNTWFIPYDTIQSRDKDRPHPATFPSRLPEMCLRLHGVDRIKTVADPFLGLGSTAVACAQLGLNFVGIEMDERYLSEAIARVKGT